jgi:hypothetical protein
MTSMNAKSVTIIANQVLHGHYDLMNPSKQDRDVTAALTVNLPIDILTDQQRDVLKSRKYGTHFALGVVLYERKAVDDFVLRDKQIREWVIENPAEREGRQMIVDGINSVGTELDYVGRFFSKSERIGTLERFQRMPKGLPMFGKVYCELEAIDKMVRNRLVHKPLYIGPQLLY